MEIMKSCYKFMLIMGVFASINYTKRNLIGGYIRSLVVLITMTICVFHPCIQYFVYNLSNLVDATSVGLMVSIGFFATVSLISFSQQQKEILNALLEFQAAVKKYSTGKSKEIFANAEQQSDWFTKRIAIVLLGFVCALVLSASIVYSSILYAKGIDPIDWMVPYKAIFPIKQTTVGRYCVILALEMFGGFSILSCVSVTGSFFVSMCIYLIAFVRSWESFLNEINESIENNINITKFKTQLTQIVQYHIEIYEMVEILINLVRAVIFSTLYGSVIFFATSMFQCEALMDHISADFFVGISGLWMSIACIFVYSFFATKVTSQIQTIGMQMYKTKWNRFPLKLRIFVQLIILRSQRPLYFHGFGIINCDMANFSKIFNSAISYYLMFRRMR